MVALPSYSMLVYIKTTIIGNYIDLGSKSLKKSGLGVSSCHPKHRSSEEGSSVPRGSVKRGGTVAHSYGQALIYIHP